MAQRRSKKSSKRKKSKRRQRRPRRVWRWLALSLLGLSIIGLLYGLYLDFQIRSQFEGKRWSLPARVYARPLELFPGQRLSKADLATELRFLNYQKDAQASAPGSYTPVAGGYVIHTRAFRFWDGEETAQRLRIQFSGEQLVSIRDRQGAEVSLARLDPVLIASIYPQHREDRILVKLEQVPPLLVQGLLAVEDRQFYDHYGVAPRAIARALWANLKAGRTVQGGSTLTQQLVKNFFLTNQRSLGRKLNEAAMALLLEWHYDKQEILEAYLNEVYLGQDGERAIHGFGLASQFYFNKPLEQLSVEQTALLIGMVKGASYYDPRRHPARARQRRDLVLEIFAEQGLIETTQLKRAQARALQVTPRSSEHVSAFPAFLDLVRRQLVRDYREEDLRTEGLQIFTSLDPLIQHHTERQLKQALASLPVKKRDQVQSAVIITDVNQGEVLTVLGGSDPRYAGFNRALNAVRQIGSLAKPAVYLTALSQPQRYQLSTLLTDESFEITTRDGQVWAPQNFDEMSHGQVPLYVALARSYNQATARLGLDLGVDEVIETLRQLGIERDIRPYPSLFLGALALTPIEVTQMYQTLAAGGFYSPLRSIRAVLDAQGQPLTRYPLTVEQRVSPQATYLLNRAMQTAVSAGTGQSLAYLVSPELAVAGKTGTTDELRDSWFAGFSGDKLAVVWLGRDDNQPLGLTGAQGALQVWGRIMRELQLAPLILTPPSEIEFHWVDVMRQQRAAPDCANTVELPYIGDTAPREMFHCGGEDGLW